MNYNNFTEESKQYIQALIECIDDGIFITDGTGIVIAANTTALGCQQREDIIGHSMQELMDKGIYRSSMALKAIEERRPVTDFQYEETEILTTAIPYIMDDEVQLVVCCEREVEELEIIKEQIRISNLELENYKEELEYMRSAAIKNVEVVMESDEMRQVVELALTAAKFGSRVLIQGESGVGKEVIARIVYKNGVRKDGPFIPVNCSAIPENLLESELFGYEKGSFTGANSTGKKGFFELANNGILFLDEIGDISMAFQTKLLRVLQENEIMRVGGNKPIPVDVQVIAASNVSLAEKVKNGEFRSDLFYRLNTFPIVIPPLRSRRRDIVPLVYKFAEKMNHKYNCNKKFSLSSLNVLQQYDWPGNVRELENLVERIILIHKEDVITADHVQQLLSYNFDDAGHSISGNMTLKEAIEETEKKLLQNQIEAGKSPAEIEKALDISRATLNRKIAKYNLRQPL